MGLPRPRPAREICPPGRPTQLNRGNSGPAASWPERRAHDRARTPPTRGYARGVMSRLFAAVAALVWGLMFAGAAAADEGMWTYDEFPSVQVEHTLGVRLDRAWLDHV